MKIALIGATGHAGSRVTEELLRRGHTVTAIVRHPESVRAQAGVTAVRGDVGDVDGLAKAIAGHDAADPASARRGRFMPEFEWILLKTKSQPRRSATERKGASRRTTNTPAWVGPAQCGAS